MNVSPPIWEQGASQNLSICSLAPIIPVSIHSNVNPVWTTSLAEMENHSISPISWNRGKTRIAVGLAQFSRPHPYFAGNYSVSPGFSFHEFCIRQQKTICCLFSVEEMIYEERPRGTINSVALSDATSEDKVNYWIQRRWVIRSEKHLVTLIGAQRMQLILRPISVGCSWKLPSANPDSWPHQYLEVCRQGLLSLGWIMS